METTQSTTNSFKQRRSNIKSCIIESWKVFAFHTKSYFRYLWFHFLMAGLGFALFTAESTVFYTDHIQSYYMMLESGYDSEMAKALFFPSLTEMGLFLLSLIAFVFANSLMCGAVFSQLRFYKATDELPQAGPFTFWHEVRQDGLKTFTFDIILVLVLGLCAALVGLLAWGTSLWVLLLLIPVFIYGSVIGANGRIQYVTENKNLKAAIASAFHVGHRHFGGYFILLLLTGIPFAGITYSALLPVSVFQMAESADMVSVLTGDPSGIPPYVTPLFILVATLGYFIVSTAYALQQWPLTLYTSAVCRQGKQMEKQPDASENILTH